SSASTLSLHDALPISVLNFMLQEFERGAYDLRSLRRVAYGGAAMPPEVADRIAAAWPWVDQVQIYGLTESGPTGSVLAPEERARSEEHTSELQSRENL